MNRKIHQFYARWHHLEAGRKGDDASVLDFDMALRDAADEALEPYGDRLEALNEARALRAEVESSDEAMWRNKALILAKLGGAIAYLRALMGERLPFAEAFEAMMGQAPTRVSQAALDRCQEEVVAAVEGLGFSYSEEGAAAFAKANILDDLSPFEAQLRADAARWIDRIERRTGLKTPGLHHGQGAHYRVEVAEVDAYWANWIDGDRHHGIRLRANLHPRVRYTRSSHISLAAHEIGGHATHVLSLMEAERQGRLDPCILNLTVHSCEAFHMEGLAQAVIPLIAEGDERPPAVRLREALSDHHHGIVDNAHLDLEAGVDVSEVIEGALAQSPFMNRASLIANLRDRGRHPLFRTYSAVYGPSRRLFLRMREAPAAVRYRFMAEMYQTVMTPAQIAARVQAYLDGDVQ